MSILCTGPVISPQLSTLENLVEQLKGAVHTSKSKNVDILDLSSQICRRMRGNNIYGLNLSNIFTGILLIYIYLQN